MQSFRGALEDAQLLLEEKPTRNLHKVTKHPSGSNNLKKSINSVYTVLKGNLRPESVDNLREATKEIDECRQNTESTFKLVWNLYAFYQQYIGRPAFAYHVDNVADNQDDASEALDSVLHAFHFHPFDLSPEADKRFNLIPLTVLNHNDQVATRYEELARRIGKAWVDDRVQTCNAPLRDLSSFQTSLFELLWCGMIEQSKRRDVDYGDDPERPEFEKALLELEKALREVIVRSKKRRFAIAFCGTVKAGKSAFLNALMGRAILPSNGESKDLHITDGYSEYHSSVPFYGLAVPASSC